MALKYYCANDNIFNTEESSLNDNVPAPLVYKDINGALVYKCSYPNCDREFTRPYNSRAHYISTHTTIRPFPCKDCRLKFVRKNDLKRHERLHSNTKPYSCDRCSHTTSRSDAMKRHKSSHVGHERNVNCDEVAAGALMILKSVDVECA